MVRYLVIHNKHEGCYDFQCYQDEVARIRLTSITINPPKIYMFNTRDEAQDFFEEYINDVDCIDIRCKRGDDVEHIDYCTCGVIELDEKGEPILFYNKKNQIFLMEHGPDLFLPNHELKNDIKNLNLTNRLIRKCKSLAREQRRRYIELGKYCEECNGDELTDSDEEKEKEKNSVNIVIKTKPEPAPAQEPAQAPVCVPCETPEKLSIPPPSPTPEKKKRVTKKAEKSEKAEKPEENSGEEKKKKAPKKVKENKEK
jgi:hypothetical protein